jgi:NAD-dependent deacetylase
MRATRPHVLWFDECYDETHYKFESSIYAARITDLLIVVGTSAQTNLPLQIGYSVTMKGGVIIDVNPETNTFSHLAQQGAGGHFLKGTACEYIPPLIDFLLKIDQNLS